ncbi:unnamed protein product, partial [Prorocentrum cordatum]
TLPHRAGLDAGARGFRPTGHARGRLLGGVARAEATRTRALSPLRVEAGPDPGVHHPHSARCLHRGRGDLGPLRQDGGRQVHRAGFRQRAPTSRWPYSQGRGVDQHAHAAGLRRQLPAGPQGAGERGAHVLHPGARLGARRRRR